MASKILENKEKPELSNELLHKGFQVGILAKGIFSMFEIISGVAMIFLTPRRVNKIIYHLTNGELKEDHKDLISNFIVHIGTNFDISRQQFAIVYLLSHGILKFILVILLWRKKLWAYPLGIIVLLLFIGYQIYKCYVKYSTPLVLLTIFDIAMIILTSIEYKNLKKAINQ